MSLLTIHTKSCFAEAVISVVQNLRDHPQVDSVSFRNLLSDSEGLLAEADGYLRDGLQTCTCRVAVWTRIQAMLAAGDIVGAQSHATANLQCGTISPEDYVEMTREARNLPPACIHPGVFSSSEDPDETVTCPACGVDIPNYYL